MQSTLTLANNEPIVASDEGSCLVCESRLLVAQSANIFRTVWRKNGEILVKYIRRILRASAEEIRSAYICARCFELFRSLEQAQRTANCVKREILKVYRNSDRAIGKKKLAAQEQFSEALVYADERRTEWKEEEIRRAENLPKYCGRREELSKSSTSPENFLGGERADKSVDALCENSEEWQTMKLRERGVDITNVEISGFRGAKDKDASSFHDSSLVSLDDSWRVDSDVKNEDITERSKERRFQEGAEIFSKNCHDSAERSKNSASSEEIPGRDRVKILEATLSESSEESTKIELRKRGSRKSGRASKYSQKPLKYSCTSCDKKWRTLAELKTHVKSHSNLRPYMCEKCGQAYKHKQALEIHVGMHNGVSPFRCNVCEKCFTQKGALMRHLPMHTGETPYQCELCGKRFVHHTSYNMHALSHTGKKSYRCHVCDLALLSTSHLKRHMRVHTGEKPYGCSLCGKTFAERYNLFAHKKIHDPAGVMAKAAKKITFKCDRCDDCFDEKEKLEQHKMEHGSDDRTREEKLFSPTYDVNLTTRNAELSRVQDDNEDEQSWREMHYQKFHESQIASMTRNADYEITQESLDIFVPQGNYDRTIVGEISSTENLDRTRV